MQVGALFLWPLERSRLKAPSCMQAVRDFLLEATSRSAGKPASSLQADRKRRPLARDRPLELAGQLDRLLVILGLLAREQEIKRASWQLFRGRLTKSSRADE